LTEPRYLAPALDAFVRALPHTYREVAAADQTLIALLISGDAGGTWFLLREHERWNLYVESAQHPNAHVILDQDTAWRLFPRGISKDQARMHATITGDRRLGERMLETVSVIA